MYTTIRDKLKCALFAALLAGAAACLSANEVDQFTQRERYAGSLPDSLCRLNLLTNRLLGQAVDLWNKRFGPGGRQAAPAGQQAAYHYLALYIHNVVAREDRSNLPEEEEYVPEQVDVFQALAKSGRGPLQALLEDPEYEGIYLERLTDNVYRDAFPSAYNVTFVVKVAGVLAGTDKIDHFFDQGYEYWRLSNDGANAARAINYGVDSEYGWFGLIPAGVFSYADLRANWRGYQFYLCLPSLFQIDQHGRMRQVRRFDWRYWIDWQFDELLNPNAYSDAMYNQIRDFMARWDAAPEHRGSYHQSYRALSLAGCFDHRRWERSGEYLNNRLPPTRPSPFELLGIASD